MSIKTIVIAKIQTYDSKIKQFSIWFYIATLNKLRPDCEITILGDFNICLKKEKCLSHKGYLNIVDTSSLKQLTTKPTLISLSSSSLIDHILCNTSENISQSGVIEVGISDHFKS